MEAGGKIIEKGKEKGRQQGRGPHPQFHEGEELDVPPRLVGHLPEENASQGQPQHEGREDRADGVRGISEGEGKEFDPGDFVD